MNFLQKILLLISISAIVFFSSCKDDKIIDVVVPPKPDTTIFKLKIGNIWEYRNAKNEKLTFEIAEKVDTNWLLSFYETNQIKLKNTYICKIKKFIQGFPELSYFAIAETDSGLYFGNNSHILVSDVQTFSYFFNYGFLKKNLNNYPYQSKIYTTSQINGKVDFLVDSMILSNNSYRKISDSTYQEFKISLFSKRYPNTKKSKLQNWKFAYGFGFTAIEDYEFVSFTEQK